MAGAKIIGFWAHKIDKSYHNLAWCHTCGGAEGTLPEHCPQRQMTPEETDAVYDGTLDYRMRHGGWTTHTRDVERNIRRMLGVS